MNIEELRDFCLIKLAVAESFPFDQNTLVFKVAGKIFLLTDLVDDFAINIRNTPEKVVELKEWYPSVLPGYHMNKKYWITVKIDGSIPDIQLKSWIDESYNLVIEGLGKKERELYTVLAGK